MKKLYELPEKEFDSVYDCLSKMTNEYYVEYVEKYDKEYNTMIKAPMSDEVFRKVNATFERHHKEKIEKVKKILDNI